MVSTWQAITIALAGSVLGALSGAFAAYLTLRATQLNMAYQEREAWRNRLIESAGKFATSYAPVFHGLNTAMTSSDQAIRARSLKAALDAHELAETHVTQVALLFGYGSAADNAAGGVLEALARSSELVTEGKGAAALKEWHRANEEHASFLRAAHAEIRPGN